MSRIRDFEISTQNVLAAHDDQSDVVHGYLFVVSEATRLWLRANATEAPFLKLAVVLWPADGAPPSVSLLFPVCVAYLKVEPSCLRAGGTDHRWIVTVVHSALKLIHHHTGWRSMELETYVEGLSQQELPLLSKLPLKPGSNRKRVTCELWMSLGAGGESTVFARLRRGDVERDVVLHHSAGPLYLEDDYPVAKVVSRGDTFELRRKDGGTLAAIDTRELFGK